MTTLKVKTNERFYREMQYKDANDSAIDISGYSIDLDIKSSSGVVGFNGTIDLSSAGVYADDTAAGVGGVATGSAYITDGTGTPILRTDGIIIATLERDTTDSNDDDAYMIEFDIHYLSDQRVTVDKNDTGSGFVKV